MSRPLKVYREQLFFQRNPGNRHGGKSWTQREQTSKCFQPLKRTSLDRWINKLVTCFRIACKFSSRQWCVSTISISRPHRFHCYACVLLLFVPASPVATADVITSLSMTYTIHIRSYNWIPLDVFVKLRILAKDCKNPYICLALVWSVLLIVNLVFSISVKKPSLTFMSVPSF